MPKLGELIRKRRQELGLKVYELANKVGVHPVYITQIEKHNKLPSHAVFSKIREVLNLPSSVREIYFENKYPEFKNEYREFKNDYVKVKRELERLKKG